MKKKHYNKALPLTPFDTPAEAVRALNAIRALLSIEKRLEATGGPQPYGAAVQRFFQAAGGAVQDGPDVFKGLPFDSARMAEIAARYQRLAASEQKTAELAADIGAERRALEIEMARMIGLVLRTARTTIESPVTEAALKQSAATAASSLFALSGERNAQKRAAIQATKARNRKEEDRSTRSSRLEIENRYLSGEELSPEDVGGKALPLAARARRRQKRG